MKTPTLAELKNRFLDWNIHETSLATTAGHRLREYRGVMLLKGPKAGRRRVMEATLEAWEKERIK